jgi:pimeloyl-ACP methyl ester carboxylesterase
MNQSPPRLQRVSTQGITYSVTTAGDPTQPCVVLLHGWLGTSHSWRKIVPLLAPTHFVVVPDMRGHGASDKPETGYDGASLAADVRGVLDALGVERAHVVGHDMGALVALVFAGQFPERTRSLTYLDEPLVGFNLDRFTVYREETHGGYWHFGFNSAPGLAELLLAGREQEFVDYIVPLMHAPNPQAVTAADRRVYADSLRAPGGIRGSVGWYRASFETARQIRAIGQAGLRAPLMAWGGQYGVPQTCEQFGEMGLRARGGTLEGVGHLIPEEAPERLVRELSAFFAELSPS